MAVKKYEMDSLIINAAIQEFLQCGYKDASLRKIAVIAGTTTGSLYMRYGNKDQLFCSLTKCVTDEVEKAFCDLKPLYESSQTEADMLCAVQAEAETILHIIFKHYDAAVLLLCKSEGSSCGDFFNRLVTRKISESDAFFGNFEKSEDLKNAFNVLLAVQFNMYRHILLNGYSEIQAQNCMKILMTFMNGGWSAIMQNLVNEMIEMEK